MAFRNGKQHLQVAINDGTPRYIAMAKSETGSPWQKANPLRAVAKAEIQYEAAGSVQKTSACINYQAIGWSGAFILAMDHHFDLST